MNWFDEALDVFTSLKGIMLSAYLERVRRLREMPKRARKILWWPFTQHKLVPEDTITVIDSRCGENFSVYKVRIVGILCLFIAVLKDSCCMWNFSGYEVRIIGLSCFMITKTSLDHFIYGHFFHWKLFYNSYSCNCSACLGLFVKLSLTNGCFSSIQLQTPNFSEFKIDSSMIHLSVESAFEGIMCKKVAFGRASGSNFCAKSSFWIPQLFGKSLTMLDSKF